MDKAKFQDSYLEIWCRAVSQGLSFTVRMSDQSQGSISVTFDDLQATMLIFF